MTTPRSESPDTRRLDGYEVLVAVCGGIAAYKACEVVSRLVQRGAGVTVAMSKAATRFVGPVTFQALSGRRVLLSLWHPEDAARIEHITQTGAADLILVAPATANIIGKLAAGIADDLVSTMLISAASPILMAPSMNDRMWGHPMVQRNIKMLSDHDVRIIPPGSGWLACRSVGAGRLAEPADILDTVVSTLTAHPPKSVPRPTGSGPAQ